MMLDLELYTLNDTCASHAAAAAGHEVRHPHDQSLATYRGHSVIQTLIRAVSSMHVAGPEV